MSEAESQPGAPRLRDDTPFSYVCHRCLRCCHDKLIQVNPYEAARLARRLGISTTLLIAEHLDGQRYLRRRADGACVFLGAEGCTVHPDRPLVCRLYPLGRRVVDGTPEGYSLLAPHPESAGEYGQGGTIAEYVAAQGAASFFAEADAYLALLRRLFDAWWEAVPEGDVLPAPTAGEDGSEPPDLQDVDVVLAKYCAEKRLPEPVVLEERTALHRRLIGEWLDG